MHDSYLSSDTTTMNLYYSTDKVKSSPRLIIDFTTIKQSESLRKTNNWMLFQNLINKSSGPLNEHDPFINKLLQYQNLRYWWCCALVACLQRLVVNGDWRRHNLSSCVLHPVRRDVGRHHGHIALCSGLQRLKVAIYAFIELFWVWRILKRNEILLSSPAL